MSRIIKSVLLGSALVMSGVAATSVWAGQNDLSKSKNGKAAAATAQPVGGLATIQDRLAALISPFTTGYVVRSAGVDSVTRPATGEYCIKPSTTLNVNSIIAIVSVDFSNSSGRDNIVQYRSSGAGCPSGQIDVLTLKFNSSTGSFVQANTVAFTILVP